MLKLIHAPAEGRCPETRQGACRNGLLHAAKLAISTAPSAR